MCLNMGIYVSISAVLCSYCEENLKKKKKNCVQVRW